MAKRALTPDPSPGGRRDLFVDLSTQHGYDRWSTIYDDEDNPLIKLENRFLPPVLGDVAGLEVLDVGCGTGRHALAMAENGARVTGIDFSAGMLAQAQSKVTGREITFVEHDIESAFPLSSNSFDRVVCGLVIDHVTNLNGLFREMHRVCRSDGRIIVSVMHPAMNLRDAQARFTDPETGSITRPASQEHCLSDYVRAVVQADLSIDDMTEHIVDDELAAESPRAVRYAGWPMLLLMQLKPGAG